MALTASKPAVVNGRYTRLSWNRLRSWVTNRVTWPEADYLVNRERKLLYCPIAKVACSSIKRWFLAEAGETVADQASVHKAAKRHALSALSASEWRGVLADDSYFAFGFIRNPWSRLVSGYLNKFLRINSCSTRAAQRMGRWSEAAESRGELLDVTFAEFVRWLAKCNPARFDVHWRPQHLYLSGRRLDFLGRLENLNEDFATLQRQLGTETPLPHVKATRYAGEPVVREGVADLTPRELLALGQQPGYRQFYTAELLAIVDRIYREDIRLGGYEFRE